MENSREAKAARRNDMTKCVAANQQYLEHRSSTRCWLRQFSEIDKFLEESEKTNLALLLLHFCLFLVTVMSLAFFLFQFRLLLWKFLRRLVQLWWPAALHHCHLPLAPLLHPLLLPLSLFELQERRDSSCEINVVLLSSLSSILHPLREKVTVFDDGKSITIVKWSLLVQVVLRQESQQNLTPTKVNLLRMIILRILLILETGLRIIFVMSIGKEDMMSTCLSFLSRPDHSIALFLVTQSCKSFVLLKMSLCVLVPLLHITYNAIFITSIWLLCLFSSMSLWLILRGQNTGREHLELPLLLSR